MKKETLLSGIISIKTAIIVMTAGLCLNIVSCTPGESPFVAIGDSVTEGSKQNKMKLVHLLIEPLCSCLFLYSRQVAF